jgi:predicted RNA binding protein YcfA (HicA-like mRNA interferase family)
MTRLPRLTGKELLRILERAGFRIARTKGSHKFLKHTDGRATVIPAKRLVQGYCERQCAT